MIGPGGRSVLCHVCNTAWHVAPDTAPARGPGARVPTAGDASGDASGDGRPPRFAGLEKRAAAAPTGPSEPAPGPRTTVARESGTLIYIAAWLCAVIPARLIGAVIERALAVAARHGSISVDAAIILVTALQAAVIVGAFALSYSLFRNLVLSKVMPWLWGLGILGIVVGVVATATVASGAPGGVRAVYIWPQVVFSIAALLAIRAFFKSTGRWGGATGRAAAVIEGPAGSPLRTSRPPAPEIARGIELIVAPVAIASGLALIAAAFVLSTDLAARIAGAPIIGLAEVATTYGIPLMVLAGAFAMALGRSSGSRVGLGDPRTQAVLYAAACLLVILPAAVAMTYAAVESVLQSIRYGERSIGGFELWPAKSILAVAFGLIAIQSIAEIIRAAACIASGEWPARHWRIWWQNPAGNRPDGLERRHG